MLTVSHKDNKAMIKLATVSPCYNEEAVLEASTARLTGLFRKMMADGKISPDSEIVFVNDGSSDRTWEVICRLQKENTLVRGIGLAHNVGHQNAIMAGMMTVREHVDAVITLDADLQDDINAIPLMVDLFQQGNDIVYGVKTSRKADPLMKRVSAKTFYKLQEQMGIKSIFNHADFRLMSRKALGMLSQYHERSLYLRGLIPMIGLKWATVDDVISEREAGKSKYTLKKMLNLALDGITSFSVRPIYLILWAGVLFLFVSLFIIAYVLRALVIGTAAAGWSSIMLSIWLVGAFVLFAIGIVGIYIGKIYEEVKHRPLYHVAEIRGEL